MSGCVGSRFVKAVVLRRCMICQAMARFGGRVVACRVQACCDLLCLEEVWRSSRGRVRRGVTWSVKAVN